MPFRLAPLAPVLLGIGFTELALGMASPLVPLILIQAGVGSGAIGIVSSAYFIGFLAGALTSDRLVMRVGHIRAFAVFAALAAEAALALIFLNDEWAVAILRLITGYAVSGIFMVAESWLNDRADADTRGRSFGAYLVVSWGGAAAGPLVFNALPPSGLLFALVAAGFVAAVLPMALTEQANPVVRPQARFVLGRLWRASPVGVVCCLASGLVNGAFYSLLPVYLTHEGHGSGTVANVVSAATLAGLLVQYPIGMVSDRFGRRAVTLGTLALSIALALGLALLPDLPFPALAALGSLLGGAMAPLYGLGAGQTNDRMERGDYVAASSGLLFAWSIGSSSGPAVAGAAMERLGVAGLFLYLAAVLTLVMLFTAARMVARPGVPRAAQGAFVPATAAPPPGATLGAAAARDAAPPRAALRALFRRSSAR